MGNVFIDYHVRPFLWALYCFAHLENILQDY